MDNMELTGDEFMSGRFAADRGIHAKFYTQSVNDEDASNKAGRPIFRDAEFVEIIAAGNSNNIMRRMATDEDRGRFRRQYEGFKQSSGEFVTGTPLSEVTWLQKSQVDELGYFRVRTLEVLAEVDDNVCSRMPGLMDLRRKAKQALEAAASAAPITELNAKLEEKDAQLAAMQEQMSKMTEALQKLQDKK